MMHCEHFFKTFKPYFCFSAVINMEPHDCNRLPKRLSPHLPAEDPALYQDNNILGSNFSYYFIVFK